MSIDAYFHQEILVEYGQFGGDVLLKYNDNFDNLFTAIQDFEKTFDTEDEAGQQLRANYQRLIADFFPDGWPSSGDEDADFEQQDELLWAFWEHLFEGEGAEYFGREFAADIYEYWRKNYAPACPAITGVYYFGDSRSDDIDILHRDSVYLALNFHDCYELVPTETGKNFPLPIEQYTYQWASHDAF